MLTNQMSSCVEYKKKIAERAQTINIFNFTVLLRKNYDVNYKLK